MTTDKVYKRKEKTMLCKDCEYFKILQEPIPHFDGGIAICEKHNLSVDFLNHGKFKRLSCIEGNNTI